LTAQQRVDAALTIENKIYLFTGGQYTRYSDINQEFSDEGYPRKIAANWVNEGAWSSLPPAFNQGIQAALQVDSDTYLFSGNKFAGSQNNQSAKTISQYWGIVENKVQSLNKIDAAFQAPDSKVYLFSGDQLIHMLQVMDWIIQSSN
jgi:hypothetical protein